MGCDWQQKKKLEEVGNANMEAMRKQMQELFQGGGRNQSEQAREQMRTKMQEMRKQADEKVLAVLTAAAGGLHAATAWIWGRPLWAQTLEWFRWVLLAIFALAVWNAARRRLDAGRMAALLFPTLLLGLGTYEYFFEFAGFARSPAHTAASLFTFSVCGSDSPANPAVYFDPGDKHVTAFNPGGICTA